MAAIDKIYILNLKRFKQRREASLTNLERLGVSPEKIAIYYGTPEEEFASRRRIIKTLEKKYDFPTHFTRAHIHKQRRKYLLHTWAKEIILQRIIDRNETAILLEDDCSINKSLDAIEAYISRLPNFIFLNLTIWNGREGAHEIDISDHIRKIDKDVALPPPRTNPILTEGFDDIYQGLFHTGERALVINAEGAKFVKRMFRKYQSTYEFVFWLRPYQPIHPGTYSTTIESMDDWLVHLTEAYD